MSGQERVALTPRVGLSGGDRAEEGVVAFRRARSSMFFASDARSAAETAAYALEEHGLTPEQVDGLADAIEDTIFALASEARKAFGDA